MSHELNSDTNGFVNHDALTSHILDGKSGQNLPNRKRDGVISSAASPSHFEGEKGQIRVFVEQNNGANHISVNRNDSLLQYENNGNNNGLADLDNPRAMNSVGDDEDDSDQILLPEEDLETKEERNDLNQLLTERTREGTTIVRYTWDRMNIFWQGSMLKC